jgi:methionine sulfoxide reductase heme-binding subunit
VSATAATVTPVWFTARAAGITALVLSSGAVGAGVLLGARALTRGGRAAVLRAVHEALALSALAAIAVHVLALLLDPWLTAGPLEVLVPFSMPYRPLATGLGQIAALGILVLGPTFYLRTRLGAGRWTSAHRFIAGPWLLALVHGVAAGTDGLTAWYVLSTSLVALPAAALLALHWSGSRLRVPWPSPPPTPPTPEPATTRRRA